MPQIMLAQSNKAYQSGQSSSMNVESNLEFRIRFVKETVSLAQWGQKDFHSTIYHYLQLKPLLVHKLLLIP